MYLKNSEELKMYVNTTKIEETEQLMILVGEKSSAEVKNITDFLNEKGIKFFGGIYSRLLVGNKSLSEGLIVKKFEPVYSSLVLPYLMRFKADLEVGQDYTAVVLVDGLSSRMKELTDTIYSKLGNKVKYVGGGAGFYDLKQRPCIFDNKGIYEDVVYVCIVKSNSKIAVKHGWNKLEGPFEVREAKGNVLCKLDEYQAFDVYRDVIEDEEHITLYKEDFFTYAKEHPFGILQKGAGEVVVRDPISLNENYEIVCVADVPEGSSVYVLKGDINTLLQSSIEIADYCAANAPSKYTPLLFDCISRAMFMEERFEEELNNIQGRLDYKVYGGLSIGEIASGENGELIIHNKSTILGLVEE
jgi:hypothetical protein